MKKLLVLGGFPQMIDIVMTAKNMGIYVIVADRDKKSPAKRFADLAVDISTDNIEALTQLCKNEKVDGVFTGFEDFNIHIAQKLCENCSLPFYATKEQLDIVTNKLSFKEFCRKCNVPVIEQYLFDEARIEGKYPYIVKPSDSYGSRGITIVFDEKQLVSAMDTAKNISPSKQAVVERYIDYNHGVELFYTIVNGNIHLTATADRYTVKNGATTVPLPTAEVFPSKHELELTQRLNPVVCDMLKKLGLRNGLVLIQALFDGCDYYVYEMAYRLTGEQHYRLVEKQNGVNLGKMMIMLALGEEIDEFDNELVDFAAFKYPSINLAYILREGKIEKLEGLEKIYKIDEVISYNLTHSEKDVILPSGNYSHMLIRVNMVANDYKSLCKAVKTAGDYIHVTDKYGEDMLVDRFKLPEEN